MSGEEGYDRQMEDQMKTAMEAAAELYRRDARFHALVSSAVAHAMEETRGKIDPDRPERAIYEAATLACMTALKQAFDGDAEVSYLRAVNKRLEELALNGINSRPLPMPILLHPETR